MQSVLSREDLQRTAEWVAAHQRDDGAIPWFRGRKMDPWDHVQSAMGLSVAGFFEEARAAYRFLAATQGPDGAWPAASNCTSIIDATRESNHAAYLASGLWHYYRACGDVDFLAEMWPTLERAMAFVLGLQVEDGSIHWAIDASGVVWPAPLLAGCASMHGSLVCATRIAERLGYDGMHLSTSHRRLARVLREGEEIFLNASVPEPPGRYSMDWYYPVLGGAVRGAAARLRLAREYDEFIDDGRGCRCVRDREWFTVAETCELVIALATADMHDRAETLFEWAQSLRVPDGGYWMGVTYPNGLFWPPERPAWTAATVILAADALAGDSPTSDFFLNLGEIAVDQDAFEGDASVL